MNAEPLIRRIVRSATAARLELIVIGNAGAALNGAPVTTLDFDFFVRDIERQMPKIRAFAKALGAVLIPAASPLSNAVKIECEADGLFLDLLDRPAGMSSFAAVRKRASELEFGDAQPSRVYVASLADIIASKRRLGRPKDLAVLPVLELTLDECKKNSKKSGAGKS